MIVEAVCFALSGFFMKVSDEYMDEKNNLMLAIIAGILCVIFTLYVSSINGDAACIFLSILIGTGLAIKVDNIAHILSANVFIIFLFIMNFPHFSLWCLILCVIAAFLDEKGNDYVDKKEEKGVELNILDKLLKYRYVMKLAVLVLSLFGLLQMFIHNPFLEALSFNPVTIIYFYLFDLCYEFSNELTDRFNNIFQSFLRGL